MAVLYAIYALSLPFEVRCESGLCSIRQWNVENALILAKYAGFLVYMLDTYWRFFRRFEDLKARFGH